MSETVEATEKHVCPRRDTPTREEIRREIDMRVGARLVEKELFRAEYVRGLLDCFTVLVFIAMAVYITFFFGRDDEEL
jgi:hypothetical protein